MKKFCILFLALFIIILTTYMGATLTKEEKSLPQDYLRIHIRANSDSVEDQTVKYTVRDALVEYITPLVIDCATKGQAMTLIEQNLPEIASISTKTLKKNGFSYGATVSVKQETFPTRVYDEFTLYEGLYDALIVELGSGAGQNWWCCIYPPFCFTTAKKDVEYRSVILEWFGFYGR